MEIFVYSSIVFLLLALLLRPFNLKISFLLLCISSTIFHMLDHDIEDINNILPYIYKLDIIFIFLVSQQVLYNNVLFAIIITIIFIYLYYHNDNLYYICMLSYSIGLIKILYNILQKSNSKIFIIALVIIGIICLKNNNIRRNVPPYNLIWNKQNAFIWHFINFVILYTGLKKA